MRTLWLGRFIAKSQVASIPSTNWGDGRRFNFPDRDLSGVRLSIGVIGQGYVGGSLTTVFAERGEVVHTFDKVGKCAEGGLAEFDGRLRPRTIREFVQACEANERFSNIFFVCVPTPMCEAGAADVSIVDEVLSEIARSPRDAGPTERIAVLKSTVPPGSVEHWNRLFAGAGLHVIFNPEFLTEANALNDLREQDRIILGGPRPYINEVKNLYQRLFPKIAIIKTSSTTAEMVKYLTNCMLAVKATIEITVALLNVFKHRSSLLNDGPWDRLFEKIHKYVGRLVCDDRLLHCRRDEERCLNLFCFSKQLFSDV